MAKVLLIEPDSVLAKSIGVILNKAKHRVVWKPDPQAAINAADRLHPDVVVLDLALGSHNGIEFLYEFRSYPEWYDIPIILYNSHDNQDVEGLESAFSELGVKSILYKPADTIAELAEKIQQLVPTAV